MKKQVSLSFMIAGILFSTCLLLANILAVKIITIGSWAAPAGIIVFPLAYIISDVIAEVWGFKKAKLIIWMGFAMNVLAILFISLAIKFSPAEFWPNQEAFATVLGSTPRIVLASLTAYLVGSFLNAMILSKMKVVSKGKYFGFRAIVSTMAGESADSLIFILVAFAGIFSLNNILIMIFTQALLKTVYEIIILPITILVVKFVKQNSGEDVYDSKESFSPF